MKQSRTRTDPQQATSKLRGLWEDGYLRPGLQKAPLRPHRRMVTPKKRREPEPNQSKLGMERGVSPRYQHPTRKKHRQKESPEHEENTVEEQQKGERRFKEPRYSRFA